MIKNRVVIPSWQPLSNEMQSETGAVTPAFIKLGGKPLYFHILRSYESIKEYTEFIIIVNDSSPALEAKYVTDFKVSCLQIPSSCSLGETIFKGLSGMTENLTVIVHMADTLVGPYEPTDDTSIIYVQKRSDLYRWTSLSKLKNGTIKVLSDRNYKSVSNSDQYVFIGVMKLFEGFEFCNQLKCALQNSNSTMDSLFYAVESYSKLHKTNLSISNSWFDCGHVESFYETKLNYLNLRHFNNLNLDYDSGLITKTSSLDSFRHQVRWYKQIPDRLLHFIPRIFASSDGEKPYVTMEYLSMPNLSDLFVNESLEIGAWNDVASKIRYIYEILENDRFTSTISTKMAWEIYVNKTRNRINEFRYTHPNVYSLYIEFGNDRFSLDDVINRLDEFVIHYNLLELVELYPIHGDMCFSNLLFDKRLRQIKLIDPRGEFSIPGIYGDQRYDKAKLLHSYSGGYDLIIHDQFDIAINDDRIECDISFTDYHKKVGEIFDSVLFKSVEERKQCLAIQALLFLSMLPLHQDKPKRQLAMLYVGLNSFFECLENKFVK